LTATLKAASENEGVDEARLEALRIQNEHTMDKFKAFKKKVK